MKRSQSDVLLQTGDDRKAKNGANHFKVLVARDPKICSITSLALKYHPEKEMVSQKHYAAAYTSCSN